MNNTTQILEDLIYKILAEQGGYLSYSDLARKITGRMGGSKLLFNPWYQLLRAWDLKRINVGSNSFIEFLHATMDGINHNGFATGFSKTRVCNMIKYMIDVIRPPANYKTKQRLFSIHLQEIFPLKCKDLKWYPHGEFYWFCYINNAIGKRQRHPKTALRLMQIIYGYLSFNPEKDYRILETKNKWNAMCNKNKAWKKDQDPILSFLIEKIQGHKELRNEH